MTETNDPTVPAQSTATATSSGGCCGIRLVIQRYRRARLLLDEKEVVTVGDDDDGGGGLLGPSVDDDIDDERMRKKRRHVGMLVYVSFSKTARSEDVEKAARTVLNLPIQTVGAWGDGVSETKSILRIASDDRDGKGEGGEGGGNVSVLLVPQANLIARVKKGGKSVQYRDQIDKETGRDLYRRFAESVESILVHRQRQQQEGATTGSAAAAAPKQTGAAGATVVVDPAVPPGGYFRSLRAAQEAAADADDDNAAVVVCYGEDLDPETGIPLEHADGTPLTKSGKKRAKKLLDAHARRHEKHLAKSESAATKAAKGSPTEPPAAPAAPEASTTTTTPSSSSSRPRLDPGFVRLVVGTFGKRQGLSLESDMGPFCHVVDL